MIDLRGVMHHHAVMTGEVLVHVVGQAQARFTNIGGIYLHSAQVQMFQAVFAQCLGEPCRCRMAGQLAHQARHVLRPASQQCLDNMNPDKAVRAGDDGFARVSRKGLGQHLDLQCSRRILFHLVGWCIRQCTAIHECGQCADGRRLKKGAQAEAAAKLLAQA